MFKVKCNANYVSKRVVNGKNGTEYHYFKFVNDSEQEIEVSIQSGQVVPVLKRFAYYEITVGLVQGQYPRYYLCEVKDIKNL